MQRKSLPRWFAVFASAMLLALSPSTSRFPGPVGSDPWEFRPNDPGYAGMWPLFSTMPPNFRGAISPEERALGSGMAVDKAWQLHTGTPSTVIAVLDSGIYWDAHDLIERVFLNTKELPLPTGSRVHDANGDGRVSIRDYADDPRVHDANGNGVLDAGDLIALFSDGVDDDQNGYVDDIAGWDFHEQDNDPFDRTRFGHGTGEAKDSVAAINNGIGEAGICGNCSFMPLRVNDSFIVDASAFARAVIYATDNGASLVQEALGSMNANALARHAVNYAYERDVVIIGSAADENSYHHNYPATLDPVVYVNAIRPDVRDVQHATSFLNFNNCSNFGARVDVAASGMACSSEATGNLSGIAGLAVSYAKSLGSPLSAGALISLIKTTATDIARSPTADRHASFTGWDTISGYGRVDAFRMLDSIRQGKVPPEARILSPGWFDYIDAGEERAIPVTVRAARPRSGKMILELEIARGVEADTTEFVRIARSEGFEQGFSGVFAQLEPSLMRRLSTRAPEREAYADAYTLRFTVDAGDGLRAESRRSFFFHRDPRTFAAMPRQMGASGESSGFFLDLDGDGRQEFVTADGGGMVHAFSSGERTVQGELIGFPAPTARSRYARPTDRGIADAQAAIVAPIAGGDVDGDGRPEIVAVSFEGDLSVLAADGSMRAGFPLALPRPASAEMRPDQVISSGVLASPVLVDLNGDHRLEIVVAGLDGRIHVYDADAKALEGFPYAVQAGGKMAKLVSTPAVHDLNGDGTPDLIFGSNHVSGETGFIFAVSGRGQRAPNGEAMLPGFPVRIPVMRDSILPTVGSGIPTSPVIADVDGDGTLEIVVHGFVGKVYLIGLDGQIKRSMSLAVSPHHETNDQFMLPAFGHPIVGDLDGDGVVDIVTAGVGRKMLVSMLLGGKKYDFDHMLGAWHGSSGAMLDGFPKKLDDLSLATSPLLADLDRDGVLDVVAGSGGYFLRAWNLSKAVVDPFFVGGWVFGSPSLGDFDGDGSLEIAATTREGYAFIWKTDARFDARSWLTFKGTPHRTGVR